MGSIVSKVLGTDKAAQVAKVAPIKAPEIERVGNVSVPTIRDRLGALQSFSPSGFSAPGVSGGFSGGTFNLSRTAQGQSALGGLQSALANRGAQFGGLRSVVAPLSSQIRDAGIGRLQAERQRTVGNLRDNLARRRVLGSSFAQDAVSRAEAEFAQRQAEFEADVGMQELQQTMALIDQQTQADIGAFQTELSQLNLEGEMAANMANATSGILSNIAQLEAQLLSQSELARAETGLRAGLANQQTGLQTNLAQADAILRARLANQDVETRRALAQAGLDQESIFSGGDFLSGVAGAGAGFLTGKMMGFKPPKGD